MSISHFWRLCQLHWVLVRFELIAIKSHLAIDKEVVRQYHASFLKFSSVGDILACKHVNAYIYILNLWLFRFKNNVNHCPLASSASYFTYLVVIDKCFKYFQNMFLSTFSHLMIVVDQIKYLSEFV